MEILMNKWTNIDVKKMKTWEAIRMDKHMYK